MGNVREARWPLPAENEKDDRPATKAKPQKNAISRITLELLDEYSVEQRKRGYNPYESATPARGAGDVWRRKPKRD
jgi:hypothetical protein